MRLFPLLVFIVALYSCHRENLKYDKPYFDFDSLVHTQVVRLGQSKVQLAKKTFLNEKRDSTNFIPDTTQWNHELDAFQQLDVINKPLYKGNYQEEIGKDNHSNLLVRSFSARIKSPVPEVKYFYLENFTKLKRIESVFEEGNVLYSTQRKLTLEFEDHQGILLISHYRVEGFQKMILSDRVLFSIEGSLIYPD